MEKLTLTPKLIVLPIVNMNDTIPNQPAKDESAYIAGENLLVTGSIGLYHWGNKFYIQVITAENENNYIVEIPAKLALTMNERDGIEVSRVNDEPESGFGRY